MSVSSARAPRSSPGAGMGRPPLSRTVRGRAQRMGVRAVLWQGLSQPSVQRWSPPAPAPHPGFVQSLRLVQPLFQGLSLTAAVPQAGFGSLSVSRGSGTLEPPGIVLGMFVLCLGTGAAAPRLHPPALGFGRPSPPALHWHSSRGCF